jgi:uncharacterized protein (DUF983 family)
MPLKNKLYSIFTCKCPKCNESDMYESPAFSYRKAFDMKQKCEKCNFNYFPEPGYYYGSMFISYIWTGWMCLGIVALLHWYFKYSINFSFAVLITILAVMFVYSFRISRGIWLAFHQDFDPNWEMNKQKANEN